MRYRQQFDGLGQAAASVMARQAEGYSNQLVGADGNLDLTENIKLDASLLASRTEDPDGKSSEGQSQFMRLGYRNGDWSASGDWQRASPGFRADLGYMPRINYQKINSYLRRDFQFKDNAYLYNTGIQADYWLNYDLDGQMQKQGAQLSFSASGAAQTQATIWLMQQEERYQERYFSRSGVEFALDSAPISSLKFSLGGVFSGEIDRDN